MGMLTPGQKPLESHLENSGDHMMSLFLTPQPMMSRIRANSKEETGILKENNQEKLTQPEVMEEGFGVYPLKWKYGTHLPERLSCP